MITLILVLVAVSVLILIHEWGHFYFARKLGVRVEEFGFGFPPRLWSRVKNGIKYSINLFPFGGFVKIFGEYGEGEKNHESFASRPVHQRFLILFAGVFMNMVLAWVLFSTAHAVGIPRIDDSQKNWEPVTIVAVAPGSPAEKSGLRFGDQILEIKSPELSFKIISEKDVQDFVESYRGEEIILKVRRGADILEIKSVPRINFPQGEGPLGVGLARLKLERTPWYFAPAEGGKTLFYTLAATLDGLWFLVKEIFIRGGAGLQVSGPVGIFFFAQDSRSLGVSYFLQFIGILSVNLAVLNFLPIPALDGGRAFFLLIEKIKGRRINQDLENVIHIIGFILLILLMVLVTYRDIIKLF